MKGNPKHNDRENALIGSPPDVEALFNIRSVDPGASRSHDCALGARFANDARKSTHFERLD